MFEQKLNPISIFRKALFFRTLHHFFCAADLFVFLLLPLVVLPFVFLAHGVFYVLHLTCMSRALVLLAAPKGAAEVTQACPDLQSVISLLQQKGGTSG